MLGRRKKNLKLLKEDSRVGSKPLVELLKEKLFADSTSLWFGSEVVYHASLIKRNGSGAADASKLIADLTNQSSDRYLAVIRKKDVLGSVHICQLVVRRETGVEFKQVNELKNLKAVEFGQDDNELVLTISATEHSYFFPTSADKEEAAWVLVKVCKAVTGFECSSGFTIDMDAIAYSLSQSGSLGKHQGLRLVGVGGASDAFAEEEAEAEKLLEERNWTTGSAPADLQKQLMAEQDELQMEIIDFLLQWEDDDEKKKVTSDGTPDRDSGVEILMSLTQVDEELNNVDVWLGQQIEQLVSIQGKLVMIEAESGQLEASWQSLSGVQRMLETLSEGLTLDREYEELLVKPERAVLKAVSSPELADVEETLAPTVDAVAALRRALSLKGETNGSSVITPAHWRQLQMMSAVSTQRGRLLDMADRVCGSLGDMLTGIFDRLLTHKALTEPGNRAGRASVTVPKYSLGMAIRANVGTPDGHRNYSVASNADSNQAMAAQKTFHQTLADFLPLLEHVLELNPASAVPVCNAYVQAVHDKLYRPLIKTLFKDLQAVLLPRAAHALNLANLPKYSGSGSGTGTGSNSSSDKQLYEPAVKFFRYSINLQNALLTPWEALELALAYLAPLVRREEAFFQAVFQLDAVGMGMPPLVLPDVQLLPGGGGVAADPLMQPLPKSKSEQMLDNLFSYAIERVLKSICNAGGGGSGATSSSGGEIDGVETVALLAVMQRFMTEYLQMSVGPPAPSGLSGDALGGAGGASGGGLASAAFINPLGIADADKGPSFGHECSPYLAVLMYNMRAALVQRLYVFLTDQLAWLAHQKADPKKSHVLGPVARFPSLVLQVVEVMGGQQMECINQVFFRLAKELFKWVTSVADSNDKYRDVVKMHNFGFFEETVGPLGIPFLARFVTYAGQQRAEAETKYVQWMVSYEFPELAALASRMEGVGARVKPEELALYVRRKDVLHVISMLDAKKVDAGVASMRSRLEKHCDASEAQGAALRAALWGVLTNRVVGVMRRLGEAAFASYQITLDLSAAAVAEMFQKHDKQSK